MTAELICAKVWSDLIILFLTRATIFFARFRFWSGHVFVNCDLGGCFTKFVELPKWFFWWYLIFKNGNNRHHPMTYVFQYITRISLQIGHHTPSTISPNSFEEYIKHSDIPPGDTYISVTRQPQFCDLTHVNIYNKSIHEHDTSNALCWVLCSFINNFCIWMSLPVNDSILWIQVTECEMMRRHYLGIVMLWSAHWCYCQCIENLLQSDNLAPIKKAVLDIARSHSVIGIGLKRSAEWEYPIDGSALLQMGTCVPEAGFYRWDK